MNGHAEPIAGNTPLASRIRTRREQLHSSSNNNSSKTTAVSRLRFQVQDSSSTSTGSSSDDEDISNNNTDSSIMQQRQFTRVPDGNDLDELEGGLSPTTHLQSTFKASSSNASYNKSTISSETRLNGNGLSNTVSEKEKYKAKQDDPLSPSSINKREGGEEIIATGLTDKDKKAMVLLVALYLLQGIPVGLAFGSIPYLLRSKLSYSQIGIFTLCTYPYSLKLLWSPIVDSVFSTKLGRRKSWIVPIQTIVGLMLWWLSRNINQYIDKVSLFLLICIYAESGGVTEIDVTLTGNTRRQNLDFPLLHFDFLRSDTRYVVHNYMTHLRRHLTESSCLFHCSLTTDIAVDGWALTLLSKGNLSYASTAQTIGLNCGYFLSFTVFLAFNSVEFSNKYFRSTPLDYPLVSLPGYLRFGAVAYIAVTGYLAFFQPEVGNPSFFPKPSHFEYGRPNVNMTSLFPL